MFYFYLEIIKIFEKEFSNVGVIVGGVIGVCVVLIIFVGILFLRYYVDVIL